MFWFFLRVHYALCSKSHDIHKSRNQKLKLIKNAWHSPAVNCCALHIDRCIIVICLRPIIGIEMHYVRQNKSVKIRSSFAKKAGDFLLLFFERSNIHGFFYFSLKILLLVEKCEIVYATNHLLNIINSFALKISDYFGFSWSSVHFVRQFC